MSGAEEQLSGAGSMPASSAVRSAASSAAGSAAPGAVRAGWFRAYGVGVVDVPDHSPIPTEASDLRTEPAGSAPEGRGGVVYLGQLPDGPITVLTGPSAVLYRALVARVESPRARVARVAHGLGVDPQSVDAEAITEFAEELVAAGLLTRND